MQIHWFANNTPNAIGIDGLRNFVSNLNSCGYSSVMFTYYNILPDVFIKLAHILDPLQQIKFVVAIRARAISPEYLSMLASGFSQIQRDRLMFNILNGTPTPEELTDGIVDHEVLFNNRDYVISHTEKFLKILNRNPLFKVSKIPTAVSVGLGRDTLRIAEDYGDYILTTLEMSKHDHIIKSKKKKIVVADIVFNNDNPADEDNKSLRYLNSETFFLFLKELKSSGINDLMISYPRGAGGEEDLHNFIKNNIERILAI